MWGTMDAMDDIEPEVSRHIKAGKNYFENITGSAQVSTGDHYHLHLPTTQEQSRPDILLPLTPIPEPGLFIDREKLQNSLKRFLQQSDQKAFILQGMGGIGKTVLLAKVIRNTYAEKNDQRHIQDESLKMLFEGLLTKQHAARILLASRFTPVVAGIPAGLRHDEHLTGLELQDSIILLQSQGVQEKNTNVLHALHKRVEGHPLGLVIIGQLWERDYSLEEIINLPVTRMDEESEGTLLNRLLTELWPRLQPEDREILTALCIYRVPVPVGAVQCFSEHPAKRTVLRLADCSLIQREGELGTGLYSVHGLIREYVLGDLRDEQKRGYHKKAAGYWESLEWAEEPTRFEQLQERIECRWHYFQAGEYEKAARIAFPLSTYLQTRCGLYTQALEIILETQEHVSSEEDQATCCNHIGFVYRSLGQYADALRYYEQAREIQARLNLEVPLATTYWNIGLLYYTQGSLEKAEEYINRTIRIEEKIGHPDLENDRAMLEKIRQEKQQQ